MTSLYQQIDDVARALQQAGKTPSLALVRARLTQPVDPVELLSTYQRWHSTKGSLNSAAVTAVAPAGATPTVSAADFARLEQKIDLILQLLQANAGR